MAGHHCCDAGYVPYEPAHFPLPPPTAGGQAEHSARICLTNPRIPCHSPSHFLGIAALAAFYSETEPMAHTSGTGSPSINLSHGVGSAWFVLALFAVALSLQLCCPLEYQPPGWHVPWWLMPWLPTVAIGLMVFRCCTA